MIWKKSSYRCTICGSSITLPYRLDRYGIAGFVCGRCYDEKLKEIYGIGQRYEARDRGGEDGRMGGEERGGEGK